MKQVILFILFLTISFSSISQNSRAISSNREAKFDRGIEMLFFEKYEIAQNLFYEFIKEYPNEIKAIDAQYYIALCDLNLNNAFGETKIKNFVTSYPSHPKTVFANFDIGSYYFKVKKYDDAIRYLAAVDLTMLDDQNRLEANFRLGYAYMSTKNFEKAGTAFARLKSTKNKYTYAANYYLGFINYKRELYDASIINLKKASENQAYKALTPQLFVNVYNKQKKYDTLIAYAEMTINQIENIKNIEEIYLLVAEACYQKEYWAKAVEYFGQYSKVQNGVIADNPKYRYGIALYKNKQYEKSIALLKSVAEKNDTLGQYAAYYLGLNWLKLDNKVFAYNAFNQGRKMNFVQSVVSESTTEYVKLALEQQKFNDAIDACREYMSKHPSDAVMQEINSLLSEAYLHTNDYYTAIKHIESLKNRSFNINKTYQLVTFYHGIELFNEEKYEDALEFFNKSLQNDFDKETTYLAYFYIGEASSALKDCEKAIEAYNKVLKHTIKVKPEIAARSYYGIAYCHYNQKEYAKALPFFKDYVDEAKNEPNKVLLCDGYLRLADCYFAIKKLKEADNFYSKAIDNQCAEQDYSYFQRGIVLGDLNKDEEAKNSLRMIYKVYPNSQYYYEALYNYGLIDFENTKYEAAIPSFTEIIDAGKSPLYIPLALQKRAIAYNNLKRYDKTVEDYKKILSEYSFHKVASSAVLGLQEALSHQNNGGAMDTILQAYKAKNPQDANIQKVEFENAKNLYFNQDYAQAITKLELYISDYPTSTNIGDAYYFLGDSYLKMNDNSNAKKNFELVVQDGKSGFLNKTIQKMAELSMETKDPHKAITFYLKLIETAANKKEISNAWNGLMIAYYEIKNYDSSSVYASSIIKNGATSVTYTNRALLYLAKNALAEDSDKSIDYLLACANSATDQYGAEAHYLLAQFYYEQKKYTQSLEFLFELNKSFSAYPKWLDRSFMLIADNYLAMNELYQAKATLISILENAKDPEIILQAKEKLEKIEPQ